jgi:hypothetical protein
MMSDLSSSTFVSAVSKDGYRDLTVREALSP